MCEEVGFEDDRVIDRDRSCNEGCPARRERRLEDMAELVILNFHPNGQGVLPQLGHGFQMRRKITIVGVLAAIQLVTCLESVGVLESGR